MSLGKALRRTETRLGGKPLLPKGKIASAHHRSMIQASNRNPNLGRQWISAGTPGAWSTPMGMLEEANRTLRG